MFILQFKGNTPLFIVSAKTEKDDKLNGLLLGADDYIEKPYDIDILLAKIKGLFKRRYLVDEISDGSLSLNKSSRMVYQDDKLLDMTAKEFDLLRENMELQKQRELRLQREKKTLVLSVSHDIKTPLSAIKLYAKAISKGLYADKDKQTEIAKRIDAKADGIEGFVPEIIKASSEDFLDIKVAEGEFYLSELIRAIASYYGEKPEYMKTGFFIGKYMVAVRCRNQNFPISLTVFGEAPMPGVIRAAGLGCISAAGSSTKWMVRFLRISGMVSCA